jgi:hypothetical protein
VIEDRVSHLNFKKKWPPNLNCPGLRVLHFTQCTLGIKMGIFRS